MNTFYRDNPHEKQPASSPTAVSGECDTPDPENAGELFILGLRYFHGNGVPKDFEKSMKLIRQAAEQGNAEAQLILGSMQSWFAFDYPQANAEAAQWLRRAVAGGANGPNSKDPKMQYTIGKYYAEGIGGPKNETEAVKWFFRAAAQGNESAKEALRRLGEQPNKSS